MNNITAGVREREDANRTREAGHLDEIQGVVANTLKLFPDGAVGFIDWLHAALDYGGVGWLLGVGATFGVAVLLFPESPFCNSSVTLCLTMF